MSGFHNILDFSDNRVELVKHMSTKVGTLNKRAEALFLYDSLLSKAVSYLPKVKI